MKPESHLVSAAVTLFASCFAFTSQAVSPAPDGGYPNQNTAEGTDALFSLTTGGGNTAVGQSALKNNTAGDRNTALGLEVLFSNTTGLANAAVGSFSLHGNTTGAFNTAAGEDTLFRNTNGIHNTAIGWGALGNNVNGDDNISVGFLAGANLTAGNHNVDIANHGVTGDSGKIRIGTKGKQTDVYISGISGVTVAEGVGVVVGRNGHLGTITSSARYKDDIKPMEKVSEAILALKPVTFRYKEELDSAGIPQFGLVAEEVEKVNPDLVAHDDEGKPYTVRYEAVNAMLLNEFLKEHRKVEEQQSVIEQLTAATAKQERTAEQQHKQIEALTATVEKVSELTEAKRSAAKLASSDQ